MVSIPTIMIQPPTPSHSAINIPIFCPSSAPIPITSEADSTRTTTYHIYHTSQKHPNLVFYTIPDHKLSTICPGAKITRPGWGHKYRHGAKGKEVILDDPGSDPRKPSYYLHTPRIWFHSPPQTLRLGGKGAPVVCMIDGECFWRRFTLDFAIPKDNPGWWGRWHKKLQAPKNQKTKDCKRVDSGFGEEVVVGSAATEEKEEHTISLNAPTIIDPRGVVSSNYRLRSFGLPGETGRDYIRRQRRSRDAGQQVDGTSKLPLELPTHLDPSEAYLTLYWNGRFTREYGFRYFNIECRWKGTSTVRDDQKYWGKWSRYNHLKLVAYLPLEAPSSQLGAERPPEETHLAPPELGKRTITLAKFTSLWAKRKVGRLSVFERGLEECFPDDVVERERLRHVLVATVLCMIQGEKEKRKMICKIIEQLFGAGG